MSQRTQMEARARSQRRNVKPGPGGGTSAPGGQASSRPTVDTPEIGLRQRLRYRFDVTLAKGTGPLILWLAAVTAAFVLITAIPLAFVAHGVRGSESSQGFWHAAWGSLTNTLDPGTVAGDSTQDWTLRFVALAITIVGIFIFSSLIGLISSVIDRMVENLRKGRGTVVETDHTLILGWSDKLHTIISELRIANANQRDACVVILADRDKVEMEDEINARRGGSLAGDVLSGKLALRFVRTLTRTNRGQLRIVCRTGDPADPADLAIVGPTRAKTVIVLGEERESPDAQNVKVMLALMSFNRDLTDIDVTVELRDSANAGALAQATAGGVRTVVSSEMIARITAQICRQAGMGAVYQDLLDFDGDELYFQELPELVGATYGQAVLSFETSSILGMRTADGAIVLNPPMNTRIFAGDQLIAVSEDDDTVVVSTIDQWESSRADLGQPADLPADHILAIGWNDNVPQVLRQLAKAATAGSRVDVVLDPRLATVAEGDLPEGANVAINVIGADTADIAVLRDVLAAHSYERIMLLSYRDAMEMPDADARTLLTLVQVRRVLSHAEHRNAKASIVAELLDSRSVQLGRVANPDDFVVSERLTSLLLAQLAENGELHQVFDELLDAEDVEITMRPLSAFLPAGDLTGADPGAEIEYRAIVREARERGESAFGFTVPPTPDSDGVTVNPPKSARVPLDPSTHVIVLAGSPG